MFPTDRVAIAWGSALAIVFLIMAFFDRELRILEVGWALVFGGFAVAAYRDMRLRSQNGCVMGAPTLRQRLFMGACSIYVLSLLYFTLRVN